MIAERDEELAAIAGVIDAGGVLLVEGPAGIGKTTLLDVAADRAAAAGLEVVTARGTPLERSLAFGIVEQLLGAAPGDVDAADAGLTVMRRYAAEVAARLDAGRLLIVVDDAQWSDPESLRALAYIVRRLAGEQLALIVGIRSGERGSPDELLAVLRHEPGTRAVHPRALSARAADAVLADRAPQLAPELRRRCLDAASGNPLFLRELAQAAAFTDPVNAAAASLADGVRSRIVAAGENAMRVAQAVAIFGDDAPLGSVAELAALDPVDAGEAASALCAIDVLAGSGRYRFVHPLLRAAVEERIDDGASLRLRRAAADLLERSGAPAERVAAQTLACPPTGDPLAVTRLRRAADAALERGAPGSAIPLLERALAEPPPADTIGDLEMDLGAAARRLGSRRAITHLESALAASRRSETRAARALELAVALSHLGHYLRSGRTLETAYDAASADLPEELRDRLRVNLAAAPLLDTRLRARPGLLSDADAGVVAGAELVLALGDAASADRYVTALAACPPSPDLVDIHSSAYFVLLGLEAHGPARALIDHQLENALAAGWARGLWILLVSRARLEFTSGDLAAAADALGALLDLPIEHYGGDVFGAAAFADVLLTQGDLHAAREHLTTVPDLRRSAATPASQIVLAQGRVAAASGDDAAAIDHFEHVRSAATRQKLGVLIDDGGNDLAQAFLRNGRRAEAEATLAVALAEARPLGVPGLEGIIRCNIGLANRDGAELKRAVGLLERSPRRLELARALIELGAAHRRAGDRVLAREPLARALEIATRCGAATLAGRAREELRTAGGRPRRDVRTGIDALTPAERRVADLAADGHSNQAIADRLFLSRKTVEGHLARTYAKLDIPGRADLRTALAEPG